MNNCIYDMAIVAVITGTVGFCTGQYLGRQDGMRERDEQNYLRREFEHKYESFHADSPEDQEKLAVFMTGTIPEHPIANTRTELERIAVEGQKPRELLASR